VDGPEFIQGWRGWVFGERKPMLGKILKKINLTTVASIITILSFCVTTAKYLKGGSDMFWSFLTTKIDGFWLTVPIFLLILLFLNHPMMRKANKLIKENKKLSDLAKLPKNLSRAVTVEIDPQWYEPQIRIIVNPDPTETPTHLCFNLRTVNRTYHSFKPEKVTIKCVCGKVKCSDSWDKETQHSKLIEKPTKIPNESDGQIKFYAPLTNFKDVPSSDLRIWWLYGTAIYKSTQPLIDTDEYATIELEFDIECELSEKRIKLVEQTMEQLDKSEGDGSNDQ